MGWEQANKNQAHHVRKHWCSPLPEHEQKKKKNMFEEKEWGVTKKHVRTCTPFIIKMFKYVSCEHDRMNGCLFFFLFSKLKHVVFQRIDTPSPPLYSPDNRLLGYPGSHRGWTSPSERSLRGSGPWSTRAA